MTDQNLNEQTPNEEFAAEPFIPPGFLLLIAAVGFLVALVVLFTQTTFSIVGWGGLAFGFLALVAWALLSPRAARNVLTGRAARFGGTSVLVTLILFLAMIGIYSVVRDAGIRIDLTERDTFSLTDASRAAIAGIGADPTLPQVRILAFYGAAQAGERDLNAALLDDYVANSAGKLSYEFIDPDQNPQQLTLYGARPGQVVVAAVGEDGALDVANAEIAAAFDQQSLTNAILSVSAQGDFVAYFLTVRDNVAGEMTSLRDILVDQLDWTVEDHSLLDFTQPETTRTLNDPALDGEVMILPGGSAALAPEELAVLQNYVNGGGDLIIFAASQLNAEGESLAIDPALNEYLTANFGLSFNNDVVLDPVQAYQSPLSPAATELNTTQFITSTGVIPQDALVFDQPLSIRIAAEAPQNVIVTPLASSSPTSYATTDTARILAGTIEQVEGDTPGPVTLAALAENTVTGGRVILFSSTSIATDFYARFSGSGIENLRITINSAIWTTGFDDFVQTIAIPQEANPQDVPITATTQQIGTISFITILLLPFGVLAVGAWVWYSNRERARA